MSVVVVGANLGLGCGFGQLEGLLFGLGLPYEVVQPARWMAAVCKGLPRLDTKARVQLAVTRRVPSLDLKPGRCTRPHTGLADACGLALWGLHHLQPAATTAASILTLE